MGNTKTTRTGLRLVIGRNNCRHPKQDDGEDMEDGRFIGAYHVHSYPLGYPPNAKDLAEYGIITGDKAEACYDEDSDEYETMDDYIVATDEATLQHLLDEGVRPLDADLYLESVYTIPGRPSSDGRPQFRGNE